MTQYPAIIDLADLDGDNGFRIDGVAANDFAGASVASAGDVNGDGFADLLIGAPAADPNGADSGSSYVLFGKAGGFTATLQLSALGAADGFRIDGAAVGDQAGFPLASAGDVNGDGFADIIIGSRLADPNGVNSGASYVVFGKAGGFDPTLELATLDGADGFRIDGAAAGDNSGYSVASAGDVNGDGFADLLVGAARAGPNGALSGASYVVFGKATGFDPIVQLSALDGTDGFRLAGAAAGDRNGGSVASAGDLNGDGFADLIVGSFLADPNGANSGASYVVFGKASGFDPTLQLSALDGTDGFRLDGEAAGDNGGWSVASAGDVNGDGFADLIIGAYNADPNGASSGSSYVVFGKAAGFGATLQPSALNGINGFRIDGLAANDESGHSVASAGDVNGDGFADLIVGAHDADPNGLSSGSSYVVFGKAGGFAAAFDLSALDGSNGFRIDGVAAGDYSGFSVASAGDINGDGLDDLIVGAQRADPNGSASGSSYVIYGRLPDAAVSRVGTLASQHLVGGDFNDTLSGRGGADALWGHGGADAMLGGAGADTLNGGDGNDRLNGGDGQDSMVGGDGDDIYVVNSAGDVVVEATGEGHDTILVSNDYVLQAGASIEALKASNAAVTGLSLTGNEMDNRLIGGGGGDSLDGGGGRDVLSGGAGADRFVFSVASDSGNLARDHIQDFTQGSDLIDLHLIDADTGQGGDQAFHLSAGVQFSDSAGELIVRHVGANTIVLGDVDGDSDADFAIVLSGSHALTGADFVL